jgi:hypothetical protein
MYIAKKLAMLTGLASAAGAIWNSKDPSSYSNIDQVNTQHVHIDLSVDFTGKKFDGFANH